MASLSRVRERVPRQIAALRAHTLDSVASSHRKSLRKSAEERRNGRASFQTIRARAGVYAFGKFRLDVSSRVLWRNGVGAVPLPSRAFDSLVYLVEHRDRLVRKNELIDAVWPDVVVTDDSLIHAISVLRRALGDEPNKAHYVQTVPRRGYRFVAPVSATADGASALTRCVGTSRGPSARCDRAGRRGRPALRGWTARRHARRCAGGAAIALRGSRSCSRRTESLLP